MSQTDLTGGEIIGVHPPQSLPKLELINFTENAEQLVAFALRTCYNSHTASSQEADRNLIRSAVRKGHHSVLEHASLTVYIEGSRALSHEVVRHRIGAYSQESQRYVKASGGDLSIPEGIAAREDALMLYQGVQEIVSSAYSQLLSMGIRKQDARYILSNGQNTRLVATWNLREVRHIVELRSAPAALPEFRLLAKKLLVLGLKVAPNVFWDMAPILANPEPALEEYMREVQAIY